VIPTLALGMETTYEELKSKVSKLEEENKALIEFNESNVEKLKHMADLEFSNQAYETANPKFAIEMLDKHNKDIYLYACKTSESKQALMKGALSTNNPNVVLAVTNFLYLTLNADNFSAMVMNNEIAVNLFFNYLLEKDYAEFEFNCLKHNKYEIYVKASLKRAISIEDNKKRKEALYSLLCFCRTHLQRFSDTQNIIMSYLSEPAEW